MSATSPRPAPEKPLWGPGSANCGQGAASPCDGERAARQGALSALPTASRGTPAAAGDGRWPVAWLHIRAPRAAIPTATSICACGRSRHAAGQRRVLALIEDHQAHRAHCPLRTTEERRNAA